MPEEQFTRETVVGQIECLSGGAVQVQLVQRLVSSAEGVEPVETGRYRFVLELGADLADQPERVAAVCRAWWGEAGSVG